MKTTQQGGLLTLTEFRKFQFDQVIPVQELKDLKGNPLADSFPYWRKHGLLPFIARGAWNVLISHSQQIWVGILDSLRMLSYEVKDTLNLCDYLFKDAYMDELSERKLLYNKEMLQKKELAGALDDEDRELLRGIRNTLADKVRMYGLKFEINHLTELISWCIDESQEAGLLLFVSGKIAERRGDKYSSHRDKDIDITEPHIYLSIRYLLGEFVAKAELETILLPQLLTENEKIVFKGLQNKNVREIQITLKEGKIEWISTEAAKVITGEKAIEIRKAIGLGNYQEVNYRTVDGDSLLFVKKNKRKL